MGPSPCPRPRALQTARAWASTNERPLLGAQVLTGAWGPQLVLNLPYLNWAHGGCREGCPPDPEPEAQSQCHNTVGLSGFKASSGRLSINLNHLACRECRLQLGPLFYSRASPKP